MNVMLVNNTGVSIKDFEGAIIGCIKSGAELPEEIADIFSLRIVNADNQVRGIVEFA